MARIFGKKPKDEDASDDETTPVERPTHVVPESSAPATPMSPTPPTLPTMNWRVTLEGAAEALTKSNPTVARRLARLARKV